MPQKARAADAPGEIHLAGASGGAEAHRPCLRSGDAMNAPMPFADNHPKFRIPGWAELLGPEECICAPEMARHVLITGETEALTSCGRSFPGLSINAWGTAIALRTSRPLRSSVTTAA
jgi:hypothetical protein